MERQLFMIICITWQWRLTSWQHVYAKHNTLLKLGLYKKITLSDADLQVLLKNLSKSCWILVQNSDVATVGLVRQTRDWIFSQTVFSITWNRVRLIEWTLLIWSCVPNEARHLSLANTNSECPQEMWLSREKKISNCPSLKMLDS